MKKFNAMQFVSDNAIFIVPLFPMTIVGMATYFFATGAGLHSALALAMAFVAAVAIELAGISSFRTLTGVYQSFKYNHDDGFVVVEFGLLVIGVLVYLGAIGLSSFVLEQQFAGAWALGAMAGMLAIAVYTVRAVGETYHKIEQEVEQDKAFERTKREQLFEQDLADREHRRRVELKQANIQTYETRTQLEHAKAEAKTAGPNSRKRRTRTTSNSLEQPLRTPDGTSEAFKQAFGERQAEQNRASKAERMEQLLEVFAEQPDIGQNAAGRTVGIAAGTTSGYVQELMEAGRLSKNGQGWKVKE